MSARRRSKPETSAQRLQVGQFKIAAQDKHRSHAIVKDVLLNDTLGILIEIALLPKAENALVELLGSHGALRYTDDRARLACALDLIDQRTMQDLKSIHSIRNSFAHLKDPGLSDDKLRENIERLSVVTKKDKINKDNYMEFHGKAVERCARVIIDKVQELISKEEAKQEN